MEMDSGLVRITLGVDVDYVMTRVNPFLMKLSILDFIMTVMCFTSYVEL